MGKATSDFKVETDDSITFVRHVVVLKVDFECSFLSPGRYGFPGICVNSTQVRPRDVRWLSDGDVIQL